MFFLSPKSWTDLIILIITIIVLFTCRLIKQMYKQPRNTEMSNGQIIKEGNNRKWTDLNQINGIFH